MFSQPSAYNRAVGILSCIIFGLLSIFNLFLCGSHPNMFFFLQVIYIFIFSVIFYRHSNNYLILFRYALLVVMPIGMSLASLMDLKSANFGAAYQTTEITMYLVLLCSLALCGASMGWLIPRSVTYNNSSAPIIFSKFDTVYSVFFIAVVVLLFFMRSGGVVGSSNPYAEFNGIKLPTGALNAIFYFFISVFILSSDQKFVRRRLIVSGFVCGALVLTGTRIDFLMQSAVLIFLGMAFSDSKNKIKFLVIGAVIIVAAWFVSNVVGVWRNGASLHDALRVATQFSDSRPSGEVLVLSTANQMIGTLYAVYAKLHITEEVNYLFGSSYLDYLPRTLPAFLGVERPLSLAYQMTVDGRLMAQGGIYEVAEVYWNFGAMGAFIGPMVISYLLRRCLIYSKQASLTSRKFYHILFLSLVLMSPRAVWYQTFVYWRVFTVVFVLFCVFYFFRVLIVLSQSRARVAS